MWCTGLIIDVSLTAIYYQWKYEYAQLKVERIHGLLTRAPCVAP